MRPLAPPSPTSTPTAPSTRSTTGPTSALPAALRTGALAAVATWAVVVLPALVGWVAAPESTVGWFSAVSVGSAIWFLGHGQSIGAGGVAVSMTPLLLLGVFVLIAHRWARRLAATERLRVGASDWSRVALRGVVPGFLVGYGLVAAVLALFTLGGPATPGVAAVVGSLLVPLTALGFVLVRPDDDEAPAFVRSWFRRGPTWLPAVWRVGWRGAGLLLAVGFAVVVLRLGMSWSAVADIQGQYDANLAGALVIGIGQLAILGNAATWALSFLAGPGFQVAVGSAIAPAAAQPGLLPLVPVLGALPRSADYPPLLHAVLLVPVAVGAWLGHRVDAELEFFGNTRARLTATAVAAVLAAGVVVALTALGNGAVGLDRLSSVGPALLPFGLALVAEVVAGALLLLGVLLLLERRRERAAHADVTAEDADEADDADGSDAADGDVSGR
ncbi:DUF6350 family protein [Terrabacter sp. NPDC000476]|uniref:cell division protein PerM n=1 Tax=Terrabacter sp. NPDC000476 TaxID=3154258 RepID=UPI00332C060B